VDSPKKFSLSISTGYIDKPPVSASTDSELKRQRPIERGLSDKLQFVDLNGLYRQTTGKRLHGILS
jgi:hypothetical protein